MATGYDVVVIGAGFAGVIAARDLSVRGHSVLLVEARDRIGGRTWTGSAFGRDGVEFGGTYVHWTQPNVWQELQRHRIPLQIPVAPEKVYWIAQGTTRSASPEEWGAGVAPLLERFFADARAIFPQPFEIGLVDTSAIEKETLQDRLDAMDLPPYERDLLDGAIAGLVTSYKEHGVAQFLSCVATYFGNWAAFFETAGTWPIEGGTKRLLDAIMAESKAEVRLSTPVVAVADDGSGVTVTTRDEEQIQARAVVVALPLNKLGDIAITPDVPAAARTMIDEKNPIVGSKIWVKAKGELQPFQAVAPVGVNPINAARVESHEAGNTYIMCLCSNGADIDATDTQAVQQALRDFIPDIEVLETACHDWATDEYSKGGFMLHRPGHFTGGAVELRQPHGRMHFVGSDIAGVEAGAIEGAMDTGAHAARSIGASLSNGSY
ncbi:flavin monoamine oxidase family protein [Mycobacteroides chelonae]|nr:NAD(P)/FAD-dependent oxidoreductase [Mycobacteroides chelonae]MBF9318200.1 FAD-dependent oxidoreductase [Mycobacteroides chelonae]OHT72341.1 amino acid oxidase [Mycobacteroides chelonae]OHT75110.1 amino acid oxidase [Mycobacteroides chelonae]OHT90176.1 amino acid oxidase [Mycobacteroides chelonae]